MDHVRVTRALWVKLSFYMFAVVLVAGVFLEFGLGWSLMSGGLIGSAAALTLHDVDEKDG